ncbi:hypothetical protein NL676_028194 [Syzygium grande]|nr:hypothetical protein NL676_028194 [Syzygium grande]
MEGMVLPKEYGYVALVLVLYCLLNFWMAAQVGMARKKYQVFYPTLYASESENKNANLFNCVQRGHQNSLELMPMFFMLIMVGGAETPVRLRCSRSPLHRLSLLLLHRLRHWRSQEAPQDREVRVLGDYGADGLHHFLWESAFFVEVNLAPSNHPTTATMGNQPQARTSSPKVGELGEARARLRCLWGRGHLNLKWAPCASASTKSTMLLFFFVSILSLPHFQLQQTLMEKCLSIAFQSPNLFPEGIA